MNGLWLSSLREGISGNSDSNEASIAGSGALARTYCEQGVVNGWTCTIMIESKKWAVARAAVQK
jgi:hypothetical protein